MDRRNLDRHLLFVLHRGLVEARLLAQSDQYAQAFDLIDALETLPGMIASDRQIPMDLVRFNFSKYKAKYPQSSFDYLKYLEDVTLPSEF
jgi:hypothetical protein